jgi:hypothetical protein
MHKKLDKEIINKIIEEYKSGKGSDTVAKAFNIHPNTVLKILKRNNISRRPLSSFTNDDFENMRNLHNQGKLLKEIAKTYGVSRLAIKKIFLKNNFKINKEPQYRIYNIREDFFDAIDTQEKAYFLGFIYADGCNQLLHHYSIVINLNYIDEDILHKLAKLIYVDENVASKIVKTSDRSHEDKGVEKILSIHSKHICLKLLDLGVVPKKSLILKYPNFIQKDLHRHFIRGYFDGDGSINNSDKPVTGLKITSTKEFLEGIKGAISHICPYANIYKHDQDVDNNTYNLTISGNRNIQKFLNWIYEGSNIHMDRKYNEYIKFCNKMKDVDFKSLSGTRGFSKSNLDKNYTDYYDPITVNGMVLSKHNLQHLSLEEKEYLSYDIFDFFRSSGFNIYTKKDLKREYNHLLNYQPDIISNYTKITNTACTTLCKIYCAENYYSAKYKGSKSIKDAFNNDDDLLKIIKNRLCINWNSKNEKFDISYKEIIKGFTASGKCYNVSIFNPCVAKFIYKKYSNEGDVVFDYSCGWGGRMLAAASSNRKYIGVDPMTTKYLNRLKNDLNLKNISLIDGCSENVNLEENSIDFSFSSPPYYDLEIYCDNKSQAYNNGYEYFYDVYWRGTLMNIKKCLKPNKWFGVNIHNCDRMLEITKEIFGEVVEEVSMEIPANVLKKDKTKKIEKIYMFKNNK